MSISTSRLEKGRLIAALVVRHCGEIYLPVFDRLDAEIRRREAASERIALALAPDARSIQAKPKPVHRPLKPSRIALRRGPALTRYSPEARLPRPFSKPSRPV